MTYLFIAIILLLITIISLLLFKPKILFRDVLNQLQNKLPQDVLQALIHSTATRTGKLNELLAILTLTQYDRLFYLREPVDFVGVKYGEGVYFIEVKSGKSRLTEDEKKLKELIDNKKVSYTLLNINQVSIAEEIDIPCQ